MSVPDEVLKLISESGNNFHAKVARWMQADGWHVSVSPYYMDQTQNKAREIDLVAEKLWPVMDHWGQPMGDVAVRLFVANLFLPTLSSGLPTKTRKRQRSLFVRMVTSARTTCTPRSTTTWRRALV